MTPFPGSVKFRVWLLVKRVVYVWEGNRLVSQMRSPLAACRKPAGKFWRLCKMLYVFEHKTQYLLLHAPFTRIVVFWHIGNVPPMISWSQICCNTATFCAVIFVKCCYKTYHGYAMRKFLPLSIKTVTCKSKGFLCLFGHISRIHCFWLKNLNLFSQNITFKVIDYLNLVEKIIRNWNVDEVSVPIISKDIR